MNRIGNFECCIESVASLTTSFYQEISDDRKTIYFYKIDRKELDATKFEISLKTIFNSEEYPTFEKKLYSGSSIMFGFRDVTAFRSTPLTNSHIEFTVIEQ